MRELARTGTTTLSITPLDLNRAAILLIVDRLTWSSCASPIQSGRTNFEFASIRRSSACRKNSSISNGNLGGRPLGLPVARCFFITPRPPPSTRQRIFQLKASQCRKGGDGDMRHETRDERDVRRKTRDKLRHKTFRLGLSFRTSMSGRAVSHDSNFSITSQCPPLSGPTRRMYP